MLTEQINPNTQDIDRLSTLEIVTMINQEDMTVAQAVQNALPQIASAIDGIVQRLTQGGRVIYIGAGTSGRLGMLDAVECVPTFGISPDLFQALIAGGDIAFTQSIEGAEDRAEDAEKDLQNISLSDTDVVIGIAASGRTPYVIGGVNYAHSIGVFTIGLSCNSPAPLLDVVDVPIAVPVGAEVIAGSTRMKAGTAQKMVLNMISTATMVKMGKVYRNLMVDLRITNEKLRRRAHDIIIYLTKLDEDAAEKLLRDADNQVKTALVMFYCNVNQESANLILKENHGFLRHIIEEPD
ncbi:MAG: N-acetylmuramic acid 6-phosphate etherase [Chloroflexi bacterium]|nr:N-acetylmuramic acid 6-phosphate etherase [Chloroflexota bacterium]